MQRSLPKLVTFDGQARSGKGTIVSIVKDYLRDELGHTVMLIDAGQIFRVLVVAMTESDTNLDDPSVIDAYLADDARAEQCVRRVKEVYHMAKPEREKLLYTDEVSASSAKIGARPLSQAFKDELLRKWLRDARTEGFDTVLLDGRALEEVGAMLSGEELCEYVLGLFFVCDPVVSAQRTLGRMPQPYETLDADAKQAVDELVRSIQARNASDSERSVQPVVPPASAKRYLVSELPDKLPPADPCPSVIVDRSVELPFDTMALPVIRLIERYLV